MIRKGLLAIGITLLVAAASAAQKVDYTTPDGRFRVVGYNDMDEMLRAATTRIAASGSPLRYDLELKSTRSAPAALIAGSSLLAPMGAEMDPAERAAFRSVWNSDAVEFRIAHDSLVPGTLSSPSAILVARTNPLRRISLAEIRRLFTGGGQGRWGDLGLHGVWTQRRVRTVSLGADTAIGKFVLAGPLRATAFADAVETKHQSRDVAAEIAGDPAAIGLANANFAGPGIRALAIVDDAGSVIAPTPAGIRSGRYPFDRFLLIYARLETGGHLAPAARALLGALLSPEGQRAIGKESRGYLPLNPQELASERRKLKKLS